MRAFAAQNKKAAATSLFVLRTVSVREKYGTHKKSQKGEQGGRGRKRVGRRGNKFQFGPFSTPKLFFLCLLSTFPRVAGAEGWRQGGGRESPQGTTEESREKDGLAAKKYVSRKGQGGVRL